ncbi:CRISPR-associated endonuclease Cas2 [Secundilactobacillus paracollinoides]|nr:CRISPR-associated endonuclease Cas2 [Secundilactobacillus paracollinoides]
MRLMVLFDLPVDTTEDRRNYRHFRKKLIREGFYMMQYSVYVRVCATRQSAKFLERRIANNVPESGLVQTLIVTEKQYQDMHFLAGEENHDIINSGERTIVI